MTARAPPIRSERQEQQPNGTCGQREGYDGLRCVSRIMNTLRSSIVRATVPGRDDVMPAQILTEDRHDALLTPDEVAEILRVKTARVREAARDGRLRAVKWGKFVRFRRQDVDTFIERHIRAKR